MTEQAETIYRKSIRACLLEALRNRKVKLKGEFKTTPKSIKLNARIGEIDKLDELIRQIL